MNRHDEFDLNAYVDGELTPEENLALLGALQQDPELAKEACQLNNLKAQVKLAYASPPGLQALQRPQRKSAWMAVAAGLLMAAAGGVGGWLASSPMAQPDRLVVLDPDGRGQAPASANSEETRIVFHLTTPDQAAAAELLDDVEKMLQAYEADGRPLRVEIVSNGEGLDILRERLSDYKERIHQLAQRYHNLTFVACKNTIDRLKVQQGIEVNIIPDAEVIDSGVDYVVKRQQEGWIYIRG
ncbi:MAG: hypothetical protein D6720_08660 [Gammaproteobacteria bacterium]|nr:MAG: hypothetical protein D6720_08660 [Gammaproteobacteria bacterium]